VNLLLHPLTGSSLGSPPAGPVEEDATTAAALGAMAAEGVEAAKEEDQQLPRLREALNGNHTQCT
jgi:hypothetical protein